MNSVTCTCDIEEVCQIHGTNKRKIPHNEKILSLYIEEAPEHISTYLAGGNALVGYYINYRGVKKYVEIKSKG